MRINGVKQGLYYLQEHINEDFLENNECSNCIIFSSDDNALIDHYLNHNGIYVGEGHITPFDNEIGHIKPLKTSLDDKKILYTVNMLYDDIEARDYKKVLSYFDLDQLSSFEIAH